MTDKLPNNSDRSELLNGKNPKAGLRLLTAITRAGTSMTRTNGANAPERSEIPAKADSPRNRISRNRQK